MLLSPVPESKQKVSAQNYVTETPCVEIAATFVPKDVTSSAHDDATINAPPCTSAPASSVEAPSIVDGPPSNCTAPSNSIGPIKYTDFSDTSKLCILPSAFKPTGTNYIRLSARSINTQGAVWYGTKQYVASGFETTFTFRAEPCCADGLAFVIQNKSRTFIGNNGLGIGYDGIERSLAVELDTFQNPFDPNNHHIAVQSKGIAANSSDHSAGAGALLGMRTTNSLFQNDQPHTVRISYSAATLQLSVTLDAEPALVITGLNIAQLLGLSDGKAWVGFTASTGSSFEYHDLLTWNMVCESVQQDTVGIFRFSDGNFHLRKSNSSGNADYSIYDQFIILRDIPLVGDWNGDGIDTPGWYRPSQGRFTMTNKLNATGSLVVGDIAYDVYFGNPSPNPNIPIDDIPIVGDWNGDGIDTIGVFRSSTTVWYFSNSNSSPSVAYSKVYGASSHIPVIGDWNGDGKDTIGVFHGGVWELSNGDLAGGGGLSADISFTYGNPSDTPITGDWRGYRYTAIGVKQNDVYQLRNSLSAGNTDISFAYGLSTDKPVFGRWDCSSGLAGGQEINGAMVACILQQTPAPTSTPTRTPTTTPNQICTTSHNGNTVYPVIAPIRNNPPLQPLSTGTLVSITGSPSNPITVDKYSIDPIDGSRWVYVLSQGSTTINGWVKSSSITGADTDCPYPNMLNSTNFYALPTISWGSYSLTNWPIDLSVLCSSGNPRKELWGINKASDPNLYPQLVHQGVDSFTADQTGIQVKSIGWGIIVGIGMDGGGVSSSVFDARTHRIWGAANNSGNLGYSVIIRYGHLYVLYGHLRAINNVWVGKEVFGGDVIGELGLSESGANRHLHLEIRSYGSSTSGYYMTTTGFSIHNSGILPIGGQASSDVAPYFYDVMQFLPNPIGLLGNLTGIVSSANLSQTANGDSATISFSDGCSLIYYTWKYYAPTNRTLLELDGYRGYVGYPGQGRQFVSPFLITTPPQ